MRHVEHHSQTVDKLLRIDAVGCSVNIIIGVHDDEGRAMTVVEVEPHLPDQDGHAWVAAGATTVLVTRRAPELFGGYFRESA